MVGAVAFIYIEIAQENKSYASRPQTPGVPSEAKSTVRYRSVFAESAIIFLGLKHSLQILFPHLVRNWTSTMDLLSHLRSTYVGVTA
jgi:hypothetical protein